MNKLIVIMSIFSALSIGSVFAQTPTPSASSEKGGWNLTPEQRENMAKMHEDMAKCLRSTKPMKECHEEMKKSCESMGKDCPMMEHGKGMHHHGEHHGQE